MSAPSSPTTLRLADLLTKDAREIDTLKIDARYAGVSALQLSEISKSRARNPPQTAALELRTSSDEQVDGAKSSFPRGAGKRGAARRAERSRLQVEVQCKSVREHGAKGGTKGRRCAGAALRPNTILFKYSYI